MNSAWAKIRRRLFSLPSGETNYTRRGFSGATDLMRARLEQIGEAFVQGYHLALEHDTPSGAATELNSVALDLRGFAFEGAAMGLALLDRLTPWRRSRVHEFLQGPGEAHTYLIHVGVGWAWARLPWGYRRAQRELDPLLGWLAFDGWGFHEGYFHWPESIGRQLRRPKLAGAAARVFDQGLGRSCWFVFGGNPDLIASAIANFSPERRADLWSGAGLAATYAGMVPETSLRALREKSGSHWPQLAQGAAFAAKARQRAGNVTDYTELAAKILCDRSAEDAARVTDAALENLPATPAGRAYEIWRQRIQNNFAPATKLQEA